MLLSTRNTSDTSGRSDSMRLVRARSVTTAILAGSRCVRSMCLSMVMKTENVLEARSSSAPFSRLDQPSCCTVRTSCPASSSASSRGRHSSSRMRTGFQSLSSYLEGGNRLLPGHRGEGLQEVIDRVPGFQIVNKVLERNAGPHEHRGTAEYLWVAVDNLEAVSHR